MKALLCIETDEKAVEIKPVKGAQANTASSKCILVERTTPSKNICVFGAHLDQLMALTPNLSVPFVLSRLCGYIEKYGLQQQSLFQGEEEEKVVEDLKKEFNESGDAALEDKGDVPAAAKLLKLFLEELPEPLIPVSVCTAFIDDIKTDLVPNSVDTLKHLRKLVDKLPSPAFSVLKYLCHFLLQVAMHADVNGLSYADLGLIFGPLIFRPNQPDSVILYLVAENATHTFVSDYHSIFEDYKTYSADNKKPFPDRRQVAPVPSSVAPVIHMKPLHIMIPDDALKDGSQHSTYCNNVPTLLIERQKETGQKCDDSLLVQVEKCESHKICSGAALPLHATRKRKDLVFSDQQPCISDRETDTIPVNEVSGSRCVSGNIEEYRDESYVDHCAIQKPDSPNEKFIERSGCFSRYPGKSEGGDMSPHPPDPKRRELEVEHETVHTKVCRTLYDVDDPDLTELQESDSVLVYADCDSPISDTTNFSCDVLSPFPRSASCPLTTKDSEVTEDSESTVSLEWNRLFDSIEPVRSEHRLSWPLLNVAADEFEPASSANSFHYQKTYEAPLSPSAFKSYLSHRSSHLDPTIPPSPPGEQEHFDTSSETKDTGLNSSVKQLAKKIHSLRKKIKRFDERYELEYGYRPSHTEKANYHEVKKLMNELHKARKELKAIKEEILLSSYSRTPHSANEQHILEDTTNCLVSKVTKDHISKGKPSMETSWGEALKLLEDDRKLAKRPECIEEMTTDQVQEEKLAIQKVLLRFESIHGKPTRPAERNTIRPLYDRYRSVKHLMRSSSFPSTAGSGNSLSLQPIMEHEAMDFFVSLEKNKAASENSCISGGGSKGKETTVNSINEPAHTSLNYKYDNSSLHELPLPELIAEHHHARSEKRRLRKILREFEAEFLRINGRKVQKEDKAPFEGYYIEYKFVKARLRLLEALLSKHRIHKKA